MENCGKITKILANMSQYLQWCNQYTKKSVHETTLSSRDELSSIAVVKMRFQSKLACGEQDLSGFLLWAADIFLEALLYMRFVGKF